MQHIKMKTAKAQILVVLVSSALLAAGCGTSKAALNDTIKQLEKQVARLETEKINIESRSAALDDKAVLLGKKLDRCQDGTRPLLDVVRLSPPSSAEPVPDETYISSSREEVKTVSEGDRPKLSLSGRPARPYVPPSNRGPLKPGSQEAFAALQPDNLGVVSGEGGAENTASNQPMEAFHAAYRAYSNKRYDEALAGLANFVHEHPSHSYADNALFWRGECYLAVGKFFRAIGEFERMLRRYPQSEKAPSGLYRIGFAYDQLRDRAKALEYYFRVVDKHPGSDAARRASRRVTALKGNEGRASNILPAAAKR